MALKPRLINADIPLTQEESNSIKEGDLVQIYNGRTTIWTQVADVKTRGYFDGIVSSRRLSKSYQFGDVIRFHRRHIQGFSLA